MSEMQRVHIRVTDSTTGKPTPVRIRFVGVDGKYYAPYGRLSDFATGPGEDVGGNVEIASKKYAYIDGACEIDLPPGSVEVEIHKGPEYFPVFQKVQLPKGKLAFRFEIERWSHLPEKGWLAGDTHAFYLSPHAALLEAAAEDLAVVNLLAKSNSYRDRDGIEHPSIPNMLAFSGQAAALEIPGHQVRVNTFNQHSYLGELALLHCHRAVFPLTFGSPEENDEWNLADWCEQCHRKKGLVIATNFLQCLQEKRGELLADTLLGYLDAIDCRPDPFPLTSWHNLLEAGIQLPLTGGSGKNSNQQILGECRTYAKIPGGDPAEWFEAIRTGKTFVTTGPLLEFTVNGKGPGETVDLRSTDKPLEVVARAHSITSFEKLQLVWNNEVVEQASASRKDRLFTAEIAKEVKPSGPGWFYAVCRGKPHEGWAHTSALAVSVPGKVPLKIKQALSNLQQTLAQMQDKVQKTCRFSNNKQRTRMMAIYQEADQVLQSQLSKLD